MEGRFYENLHEISTLGSACCAPQCRIQVAKNPLFKGQIRPLKQ